MTDRERAEAVVRGNLDILDAVSAREIAADIEEALTAVRLDERRVIAAHLREMAASRRRVRNLTPIDRAQLFDAVADLIEAGEHAGGTS